LQIIEPRHRQLKYCNIVRFDDEDDSLIRKLNVIHVARDKTNIC